MGYTSSPVNILYLWRAAPIVHRSFRVTLSKLNLYCSTIGRVLPIGAQMARWHRTCLYARSEPLCSFLRGLDRWLISQWGSGRPLGTTSPIEASSPGHGPNTAQSWPTLYNMSPYTSSTKKIILSRYAWHSTILDIPIFNKVQVKPYSNPIFFTFYFLKELLNLKLIFNSKTTAISQVS